MPLFFLFGLLNVPFFLLFLAIAVGLGTLMSWVGLFSEVATFRRFDRPRDVLALLAYGVLENVVYRQWKAYVAWHGLVGFLRGDASWGEMTRVGLER